MTRTLPASDSRLGRTLLNWRWWVCLPLILSWMLLAGLYTTACFVVSLVERATREFFDPMYHWIRRGK